ncbi:efflux transporter outer membrane subunit [Candidatus Protochlamydia phocaeensis]|uniref:efflux transporter outer membrane subunit n=1 Tax=Candidatus Protochlamydia phocaeensis TaxID=1414722 RepID=UPI000ACC8D61|nr:efflux transporter outer membrane subunit [Candidatus Protochlamydia phocaeensis]
MKEKNRQNRLNTDLVGKASIHSLKRMAAYLIYFALGFGVVLTASCSVGPAYRPPSIEIPCEWKNQQNRQCKEEEAQKNQEFAYLDYWWQVFDDEKLDGLEALAIENNRDLFIAFERIQEARALVGIAAADFYPQATVNPLFTNTVQLNKTFRNPALTNLANTGTAGTVGTALGSNLFRIHEVLYSLPFNFRYEVDLWGKIRDRYRSAVYDWRAMQKDYEVVMLSLTSNLAIAYYQIRALDKQLDLLSKVIQTRQKAFNINKDRYEGEMTTYADVTLAGEEWDAARLQYEEAARQRKIMENEIAILLGVPASDFSLESMPLQGSPPCIPAGIPSEVLLRRPDVAEAEYNVLSEHQQVKLAYSLFFPSLTLTATTGFESPVLKDFLKWISRYWSNSTEIDQIVFDGGMTYYNFKLQIARFQEASGNYQQQVLTAFQDVENALGDLESYAKQEEIAQETVKWAQKTHALYLDRYTLGVIYYIDVANTERDLLNFQIDLNALQGLRFVATIQLIRALGGGW